MSKPTKTEAEVLYEFSLAQDRPDARLLADFVREYPEHARALTAFAAEWAMDAERERLAGPEIEAAPSEATSPAASRAMSHFLNVLYSERQREQTPAAEAAPNPFDGLGRNAFRQLASSNHMNTSLLTLFRDRMIVPESVPSRVIRGLAGARGVTPDVVARHLRGPRRVRSGQRYKSDQKPALGDQQPFEDAVRAAGLPADEQRWLLSGEEDE